MIALKDPVKFEKYFKRIFTRMGGQTAPTFARAPYRGTTINYRKDMAYAISGGFFVVSGSVAQVRRSLDGKSRWRFARFIAGVQSGDGRASASDVASLCIVKRGEQLFQNHLYPGGKDWFEQRSDCCLCQQTRSAIGVTMIPDADGLMLEVRVPTEFAVMALAAMVAEKPNDYGINSQTGARPAGRRTPTLTDEDLKARRP